MVETSRPIHRTRTALQEERRSDLVVLHQFIPSGFKCGRLRATYALHVKQNHGNALLHELKITMRSLGKPSENDSESRKFTPHRYAGKTSDFDPRKRAEFKNAPFLELTRICQSQWIVAGG